MVRYRSNSRTCSISKQNLPYVCFFVGAIIFIAYIVLVGFSSPGSPVESLPHAVGSQHKLVSLRALLSAAITAAENGGQEVFAVRKESDGLHEKSKGKTREGVNDPLTDGDLRSHYQMYYGLRQAFPSVNIISEEHGEPPQKIEGIRSVSLSDARVGSHISTGDASLAEEDITIWIDPLDATKEYTENLLQYVTTMVCVAVKGKPIIGVIHKPFEKKTWWAWAGKLVSNEIKELLVANKDNQSNIHQIIVSRSHAGSVESVAKKSLGEKSNVIPAGGAGFKSLEVVAGRANVYIHTTLIKKWDICAGNAILNAIGGNMTTLNGGIINYDGSSNVKNEGGLIATLKNHKFFVDKLQNVGT